MGRDKPGEEGVPWRESLVQLPATPNGSIHGQGLSSDLVKTLNSLLSPSLPLWLTLLRRWLTVRGCLIPFEGKIGFKLKILKILLRLLNSQFSF